MLDYTYQKALVTFQYGLLLLLDIVSTRHSKHFLPQEEDEEIFLGQVEKVSFRLLYLYVFLSNITCRANTKTQ